MTKNEKKTGQKNVLRDPNHSFDGIQEYDNDMPGWWVNMFIISVIFGAGYLAWYHLPIFPSKSIKEEYLEAKAQADELRAASSEQSAATGAQSLTEMAADEALVAEGKAVYDANCLACHAADGGGLVGPNLIDDFWIHGTTYEELYPIVAEGILEKGMPAWEPVIGAAKINASLAYIMSLQGGSAAAPKDPEGEEGRLQ